MNHSRNNSDESMTGASAKPTEPILEVLGEQMDVDDHRAAQIAHDGAVAAQLQAEEDEEEQASSRPGPSAIAANFSSLSVASSSRSPVSQTAEELFQARVRANMGLSASTTPTNRFSALFESSSQGPLAIPSYKAVLAEARKMAREEERRKHGRGNSDELSEDRPAKGLRYTEPTPPFNFMAIDDRERNVPCIIQTDTDTTGQMFGDHKRLKVRGCINPGRLGSPQFVLEFSQNFEGDWNTPHNPSLAHEIVFTYPASGMQPVSPDRPTKLYYIENFKYGLFGEPGSPVFPKDVPNEDAQRKTYWMTFVSNGCIISGGPSRDGADIWVNKDRGVLPVVLGDATHNEIIESLCFRSTPLTVWFFGKADTLEYKERTMEPFAKAIEMRIKPLHMYRDSPSGKPDVTLQLEPIDSLAGGLLRKVHKDSVTYTKFANKRYYQSTDEWQIVTQVGAVREFQYRLGETSHLTKAPHAVFLLQTTRFDPDAKQPSTKDKLTRYQSDYRNSWYAYVRVRHDESGSKNLPVEGSRFRLDWINHSGPGRRHKPAQEKDQWTGRVIRVDDAELTLTKTDFCCFVYRPPRGMRVSRTFTELRHEPELPRAHIYPDVDATSVTRELEAIAAFAQPRPGSHVQETVIFRPDQWRDEYVDLRKGPDGKFDVAEYEQNIKAISKARGLNQQQEAVLRATAIMKHGQVFVKGPPGTGKTGTVAANIWALAAAGHVSLVVAPRNVAVDQAAAQILQSRPEHMKPHKVLRLGVPASEWINAKTFNPNQQGISKLLDPEDIIGHDPIMADMVAALVSAEHGAQAALLENIRRVEKDYSFMLESKHTSKVNKHNDPELSLSKHIWDIVEADHEAWIAQCVGENLDDPDVVRKNPSGPYRKLLEKLSSGYVSPVELKDFLREYLLVVSRAIQACSVVVTTCNNSGCLTLSQSFSPSVLHLDEACETTEPNSMVPIATYTSVMGYVFYGDPQQLEPLVTSRDFNEFYDQLRLPYFTKAVGKGYVPVTLNTQYRMAPAIAKWPAEYFYGGLANLRNGDNTLGSTTEGNAVCRISEKWGIQPGSQYFMINVTRGMARREVNGPYIGNYAHAEVIVKLLTQLQDEGVELAEVAVLVFYKGQIRIIRDMLERKSRILISDIKIVTTVDSYQGNQARVTIVDFVATGFSEGVAATNARATSYITNYTRSPNRINVAFTRAQYGQIIICNAKAMIETMDKNLPGSARSTGRNPLFDVVEDVFKRKILALDGTTQDTYPQADRSIKAVNELADWSKLHFLSDRIQERRARFDRFRNINAAPAFQQTTQGPHAQARLSDIPSRRGNRSRRHHTGGPDVEMADTEQAATPAQPLDQGTDVHMGDTSVSEQRTNEPASSEFPPLPRTGQTPGDDRDKAKVQNKGKGKSRGPGQGQHRGGGRGRGGQGGGSGRTPDEGGSGAMIT